jgi:catechol 2,3-dioxygenase-like lactoylglutathione lyase family enzyme
VVWGKIVVMKDEIAMPKVDGILETAIHAVDPGRTAAFYRRLFEFDTLLESDRLIALNVSGRNVLLIFKSGATSEPYDTPGGTIPGHRGGGTGHFAFSIASQDVQDWRLRLKSAGVAVESAVKWPSGAESLYFRDPDHHLVELMTPGFWRLQYSDA